MYRKILIGGVTAAAIVGAGGAALAVSGSGSDESAGSTVASSQQSRDPLRTLHALRRDGRLLRRVAHGQVVVRGADGFVTHDVIVGTVTSVSPTSITVRAADNTRETYVITKQTRVRVRGDRSRGLSSIDALATGDHVVVAGTGTSTLTATHVLDLAH